MGKPRPIRIYRAIGTVKEIKIREAQFARLSEGYLSDLTSLREYQAIGTVEEFQALKEKSVAKKPNKIERKRDEDGFIYQIGECPCCGKLVTDDRECCDCMQKLDWQ